MTIEKEQESEIRRLHYAEHWRVGTIATQLGVHAEVVLRVLGLGGFRPRGAVLRVRRVDPFVGFIEETLERYPRLRATRLYDMVRERGYTGSVRTLRQYVSHVRPRPKSEAYLRLEPLLGEQAQIDWAHVGRVAVDGGYRALWLFVIVLAWSRALWGEFVLDLSVHSLCRSLVRAARFFGGVTRQWLFDNPKIVVLERHGDAVKFHPLLLELCGRMLVQPRLCAVAHPEHKGRVERSIRYLRERFLAGRTIVSVPQGNEALLRFCSEIADARPHPRLPGLTVAQAFEQERTRLLSLPDVLPPTDLVTPVRVDKTAFVRLDTNLYSAPPAYAGGTLTLVADDVSVRLLDGATQVAGHERSFGRKQVVGDPAHREELLRERHVVGQVKGRERLRAQLPQIDALLERWIEAGRNLGSLTARTVRLLELYGKDILGAAVVGALEQGLQDPSALAVLCEKLRRENQVPVPVAVELGQHVPDRDVIPHALETYDAKR
jgi:transposase